MDIGRNYFRLSIGNHDVHVFIAERASVSVIRRAIVDTINGDIASPLKSWINRNGVIQYRFLNIMAGTIEITMDESEGNGGRE